MWSFVFHIASQIRASADPVHPLNLDLIGCDVQELVQPVSSPPVATPLPVGQLFEQTRPNLELCLH